MTPTSLSTLMKSAWAICRWSARRFGGRPVQYLSGAMKEAWAEARKNAPKPAVSIREGVAELVAEMRAKNLVGGPGHVSTFRRRATSRFSAWAA